MTRVLKKSNLKKTELCVLRVDQEPLELSRLGISPHVPAITTEG
jgi:hypothetical protein